MGSQRNDHGSNYLDYIFNFQSSTQGPYTEEQLAADHPNYKIEMKVRLSKRMDEHDMKNLRNTLEKDGMSLGPDSSRYDYVVSGTPPNHGYGGQNVLEAVQRYDARAQLISFKRI